MSRASVTHDVAAYPAVVPPHEQAEHHLTHRTVLSRVVRLPYRLHQRKLIPFDHLADAVGLEGGSVEVVRVDLLHQQRDPVELFGLLVRVHHE